jgi:hypothetical protein
MMDDVTPHIHPAFRPNYPPAFHFGIASANMAGPSKEDSSQSNREHGTSAQARKRRDRVKRRSRLQQHLSSLEKISNTPIRAADHPIPSIETAEPDRKIKVESSRPEPSVMAPAAEPKTPIRVPKASATYTPSTQDPELRTDINSRLLADGHITT